VSNASPTAERQTHDQFEPPAVDQTAFRPTWRKQDRLQKMFEAGAITVAELRAAEVFRATYETAFKGTLRARPWDAVYIDRYCRRPGSGMTQHQADALRRLQTIATALGGLFPLAAWVVVDELPWTEIARRLALGDCRTCKKWTVAALSALAAM